MALSVNSYNRKAQHDDNDNLNNDNQRQDQSPSIIEQPDRFAGIKRKLCKYLYLLGA